MFRSYKNRFDPVMAGLFMPFLEVLMPEKHGIFLSS